MPRKPPTLGQIKPKPKTQRKRKSKFYDKRAWRDGIRPAQLSEQPLCEDCLERGTVTAASEVDHVDGNPHNNDLSNLRSLCKPCHSRKTYEHDGSFGRTVKRKGEGG